MFHVIFLATIALAAAGKDKMPEYEGMCLDPMETVKLCTMGTDMGTKMAEAAMTCKDYDVTTMRKKKPNKGKGKGKKPNKGKGKGKNKPMKCPSVDDIEMMFMEAHAMPLCMFSEVGWMDDEMNEVKEVIDADIAQLPGNLTTILSDDSLDMCAKEMLEKAEDCPKAQAAMKACGDKYDEEENKRIMEVFYATAHIECFLQKLHKGCAGAVKEKIMGKAMEMKFSSNLTQILKFFNL